MNNPVVSPLLIYALNNLDYLRGLMFLAILTYVSYSFFIKIYKTENVDLKMILIKFFVLMFFFLLIPSKNTVIKMYVANKITYSLLHNAKKEIKNDVTELIKTVNAFKCNGGKNENKNK